MFAFQDKKYLILVVKSMEGGCFHGVVVGQSEVGGSNLTSVLFCSVVLDYLML